MNLNFGCRGGSEMNLTKEVQEAIARNLSSATASELKKFIEEGQKAIDQIVSLHEKIAKQTQELDEQSKIIISLKEMISAEETLAKREITVRDFERKLDNEILKIRLGESERRNNELFKLVDKVFGHPSVTISKTGTMPVAVAGNKDCCGFAEQGSISETTTTTEGKQ